MCPLPDGHSKTTAAGMPIFATGSQGREGEKRTSSSCYCFHFHISCFCCCCCYLCFHFVLFSLPPFAFFFLSSSLLFRVSSKKVAPGGTFHVSPLPFSFFTLPSSAFAVAPNLRIPSTFELRSDCAAAAPRYNLSARLAGLALPTDIAQLKGIGKQKVRQQRCVAKASKKGSHSGCKNFITRITTL